MPACRFPPESGTDTCVPIYARSAAFGAALRDGRAFARVSRLARLPLLLDSSDPTFASREVLIAADIVDADEEVVKAILETNRIRTFAETLPAGKTILHVESMTPSGPAPEDPRPVPIIIVP